MTRLIHRCEIPGCGVMIQGHLRRCSDCSKEYGRPSAGRAEQRPPAPPEDGSLVPCCGPIGAGCPDEATVARVGKRKRCEACQGALKRVKA
jgi:hypothetical protein